MTIAIAIKDAFDDKIAGLANRIADLESILNEKPIDKDATLGATLNDEPMDKEFGTALNEEPIEKDSELEKTLYEKPIDNAGGLPGPCLCNVSPALTKFPSDNAACFPDYGELARANKNKRVWSGVMCFVTFAALASGHCDGLRNTCGHATIEQIWTQALPKTQRGHPQLTTWRPRRASCAPHITPS